MEQAVIAHLRLKEGPFGSPKEREAVRDLEKRLERAIQADAAGEFDGDEFGNNKCVLFMYGPDADRLFKIIEPILKSVPLTLGGYAIKRYGEAHDSDAREVRVTW
jgi:hypothetical protein